MRNNAEQALWLCQGKCLYIEHTRSWLFLSQLLVSISIYCTFVPENTCLFLWWFSSSAFHWPYYSPHSKSCWFVQHKATTMLATLLQSCLTLYDPMDYSLPGSIVHGDSPGKNIGVGCHALSRGSSWPRDRTCVSYVSGIWQAGSLPLVPPYFIKDEGYNGVS